MSGLEILLEQQRGPKEALRVCISEFKGRRYCDLRVWYVDKDGELRPGKAGVTLRPEILADVLEALRRAQEALETSP
jgi:hypothetical protein